MNHERISVANMIAVQLTRPEIYLPGQRPPRRRIAPSQQRFRAYHGNSGLLISQLDSPVQGEEDSAGNAA